MLRLLFHDLFLSKFRCPYLRLRFHRDLRLRDPSSVGTDLHSTSGKNEIPSWKEVAGAEEQDADYAEVSTSNKATYTSAGSGHATVHEGTGDSIVEGFVCYSTCEKITEEVEVSVEA